MFMPVGCEGVGSRLVVGFLRLLGWGRVGDPVVGLHPVLEEQRPDGELWGFGKVLTHAGAVGALLEDVELSRDAGAMESVEEEAGVAGVYLFVELGGVDEAG